jgi:hypothetical protein
MRTGFVRFSVSQGVVGTTCLLQAEVRGSNNDSSDYEYRGIFSGAFYPLTVLCNYRNVATRHDPLL